jgi:hypothetical protein
VTIAQLLTRCVEALVPLLSVVAVTSLTSAQTPAPGAEPEARSRALFDASLAAHRAGEVPRALCLMQAAQAASSHTAFLFNIGRLQHELGQCAEARASYRAYLEWETDPALRSAAERAQADLQTCQPLGPAAPGPARSSQVADAADCARWVSAATSAPGGGPAPAAISTPVGSEPAPPCPGGAQDPACPRTPGPQIAAAPRTEPSNVEIAPANTARTMLTWALAGASLIFASLAVYEGTQMAEANRAIGGASAFDEQYTASMQQGKQAETLVWVFGLSSALTLTGAVLVHVLVAPTPRSEARERASAPGRAVLRF